MTPPPQGRTPSNQTATVRLEEQRVMTAARGTVISGSLLAAACVIPFLVLVAAHWRTGPLRGAGDWAQFLLHAQAIVNRRPYGDIGYLFTYHAVFVGPRAQPPG